MGFQKQVNITPAVGRAGLLARNLPDVHLPKIAEGEDLLTGSFGFAGTTDIQVKAFGEEGEAPLGIVILDRMQSGNTDSLEIKEGQEVALYLNGFIFFKCEGATVGQRIAINPTTAEVEAYTPVLPDGAVTGTVEGTAVTGTAVINISGMTQDYVDTGWVVDVASNGDGICVIHK